MKLSVVLLFIFGIACKSTISSATDDGSILSADGVYLPGSILSFTENLNQLKKHTEPGGYDHLRELIESLAAYDQAYSQREFPIIVGLYLKTIKTLRELAPHLKSQKLAIAANFVADECEKLVKKLVANGLNNGGFKDIQELVKVSSARLKHELQNL